MPVLNGYRTRGLGCSAETVGRKSRTEPSSAPYAAHPSCQMIKCKREGRTHRPLMPQHLPGRSKSTWRLRLPRPAPSVPRSRSSSLPSWWRCSPWVAEPVITLVSMRRSRRARLPSKRPSPQSTPCGLRSRPRGGTRRPARAGCHCTSPARRRAARKSTSFAMSTARERASSSVAAAIRPGRSLAHRSRRHHLRRAGRKGRRQG